MIYKIIENYLSKEETEKLLKFIEEEFGLTNIVSIEAEPNALTKIKTLDTSDMDRHSAETFRKFVEEHNKNYEGK